MAARRQEGVAAASTDTIGGLFEQVDGALLGVSRYLANDLGQPRIDLLVARANLAQLRDFTRELERLLLERAG